MVTENPDKTEFIVDFLLSGTGNDKTDVQEFNIYHYKQVALSDKKKGILVYAYSKRAYGDSIIPFLKNLKEDRINLLNAMIASKKPAVRFEQH